jgi:hypothetical protein
MGATKTPLNRLAQKASLLRSATIIERDGSSESGSTKLGGLHKKLARQGTIRANTNKGNSSDGTPHIGIISVSSVEDKARMFSVSGSGKMV